MPYSLVLINILFLILSIALSTGNKTLKYIENMLLIEPEHKEDKTNKSKQSASNNEQAKKIATVVFYILIILFSIGISVFITDIITENTTTETTNSSEPKARIETLGTLGDFLGGTLNPILTFFTFIGLLVTLVMQRKAFDEQSAAFEK